jgi:hypothetical protein
MRYLRNPKIIFLVLLLTILLSAVIKKALSHSIRDTVANGQPVNILLLGIDANPVKLKPAVIPSSCQV